MFFKYSGVVKSLFGIAALMLTSCTPKIGEQPPDPTNIELGATKCLSKAAVDLKSFFDATVTDENLVTAWRCVEAAFVQFDKYVVGRDQDRYTSQEMVTFLERNFFEDDSSNSTIHKELQLELMKLKQVFIGGSMDYVTRDELKKSQTFLREISDMTVAINPFMKIIMLKWKPNLNSGRDNELATFERSNLAAQVFAKKLSAIIKSHASVYKIADTLKLVQEFEVFFKEDWLWIDDLQKLLPAGQKLKKALAGGNEELISNLEWPPVLTLGIRGYYQYLRYHYFIKSTSDTGGGIRLVYIARTLEDIFSIFQELLLEKEGGTVSQGELFEILKAFEQAWVELKISPELLSEFMKIKQVLIGGSSDAWTAADFENARLKVPELRRIVENFLSYYSIYAFEWDPEEDTAERSRKLFEEARSRLYIVGQDISRFLQGSYSFQDMISLVKEYEKLYPPQTITISSRRQRIFSGPVESISDKLRTYEPLFIEFNKIMFERSDTVIEEKNWVIIVPIVARLYSLYQYYDYFMIDKSIQKTQSLLDTGNLFDSFIVVAQDLLRSKKGNRFAQLEVQSIVRGLRDADFIPESLTDKSIQDLATAALEFVLFDPERRLKGEKNQSLSNDQLVILKDEFKNWLLTQVSINEIFNDSNDVALEPAELLKKLGEKLNSVNDRPQLKQGLQEVYQLLNSPVSQTLDPENQLQISNRVAWKYRLNAVFSVNVSRFLSRLLVRSFSTDPKLAQVSECDAENGFQLLVGVFRDLDIFNPSPTFISSRFLEANIFMPRANGDKFLDVLELGELLGVVFSGLRVNDKLEQSLRTVCPISKDKEKKEFTSFRCLSEHHYVAVRKYMGQLPEFKSYVDKLAKNDTTADLADFTDIYKRPGFADWNIVFRAALKATGWLPNDGYEGASRESVYFSDMLYYPFIVHYLEYVYARFDATKNGALQVPEAKRAFPIFEPLLKDLAKEQIDSGTIKESDLLAVFTYILKYKEQPSASSITNIYRWLTWRGSSDKWDLWVTRTEMSQILGYIADQTKELSDGEPGGQCKAQ